MAKEAKYSPVPKPIFRETFESEASVRANGGVPTAVTFQNGVASFNGSSSYTTIPIALRGIYTVRIRIKNFISKGAWQYLADFRVAGGIGYIAQDNLSAITASNGTKYLNGLVYHPSNINPNLEVVVSGMSISCIGVTLGKIATLPNDYLTGQIDLFEIYQGTLTAQEVANLYNNSRYKQLGNHGEVLGPELITDVRDREFSEDTGYWTKSGASTISNGVARIYSPDGVYSAIFKSSIITVGRQYRIKYTIVANRSGLISSDNLDNMPLPSTVGEHSIVRTCVNTGIFQIKRNTGTTDIDIDNISIREVLTTATPILEVDAFSGAIKNRMSGGLTGELITNREFDTSTEWLLNNWIISGGVASTTASSGTIYKNIGVVGRLYRFKYTIVSIVGGRILPRAGSTYGAGIDRTQPGTYVEYLRSTNSTELGIYYDGSAVASIDNISIQEVIPDTINTDVRVVKDGGLNVMRFNGTTSKLDCGAYYPLTGDITVSTWVKAFSGGEGSVGVLIDNTKIILRMAGLAVRFFSDGSTGFTSSNFEIIGKFNNIVIIRKSDGKTTFFINGVLIGLIDQSTGTPSVGSNIIIGNNIGQTRTFDGNIASVKIYSGILSQQEISQIYTSEKSKYQ